jgi:YVTN family beta-propeller protein
MTMKNTISSLLFITALALNGTAQNTTSFSILKKFPVAGNGSWDYIAIGPGNNRLYVAHDTRVNIIDQSTGDSIGVINTVAGVHGIAFARYLGKGYITNGKSNNISIFDIRSNEVAVQVPTGQNPGAIIYEAFTKMIITCNSGSNNLSVIDPALEKVIATIPVGGKPNTAVSNAQGKLFVTIEDKNEVVVVDIKTGNVERRWPLTTSTNPTGLAFNFRTNRLFVGCNKSLVVMDVTNGKIITRIPIGEGCDGIGFDSGSKNIFASCSDGTLSIVHEDSPFKFTVIAHLPTQKGARTLAVDEVYHAVYLPVGERAGGLQVLMVGPK